MKITNALFATAAFCLLATAASAAQSYYMLPAGGTTTPLDGRDWAHALPKSMMNTVLNTTMVAGDTLYVGSGTYTGTGISLTSSGTASAWKSVIGVDTGTGFPHFNYGTWSRTSPSSGQHQILVPGNYWRVENLELSHAVHGIFNKTVAKSNGIYRNIHIHDVEYGMYLYQVDNTVFDNVTVTNYTKHGFRLEEDCNTVDFINCRADMTDGDESWWTYAEAHPFGFFVCNDKNNTQNTLISFYDCTAANNRKNLQSGYWNGDGFVVEVYNSGISFKGCIALNNEDGGFDIKPAAILTNCISVRNYRGFRLWHTVKTLNNCTASFPFRRADGNTTGAESGSGVWTQNGASTLDSFSFYANTGTALEEDGTGSLSLTNSILAFSGSSGSFTNTGGSITLGTGTVTYKLGNGTDPDFVSPSSSWDGIGDAMDSQTYTGAQAKGYSSAVFLTREAEELGIGDSGEGHSLVLETPASGGKWIKLNADGIGDWVEFTVPRIPEGTYTVKILSRNLNNRGIYQLNVDGSNVGSPINQYHASGTYPATIVGDVTLTGEGDSVFRFTVTGKNAASSGYTLSVDAIVLEPRTSIGPEADTYVWDGSSGSNYGTDAILLTKSASSGYNRISFLRFPVSGTVSSAILKLKVVTGSGSGSNVQIRQLANDTWSETGTTWGNRPSSAGTLIATIDAGTTGQEHTIDVTTYVNQEAAGDGKASFVLVQPSGTNKIVSFGSRENAGNEPELELQP